MKHARTALVFLGVLTGCAGLIGVPDLTFDENAANNPDGGAEGSTGDVNVPVGEGGPDAPAPPCDESKLATDPRHCGRCGHDCLGGVCVSGVCESVVVATGLSNPVALAIDATNVYVTSRGNGAVLAIPKAGGNAKVLASGFERAQGVAVSGTTLYWSSGDFGGDGGGDSWGGLWTCTLPECTDKRFIAEGDFALNVVLASNGFLYFAENNNSSVVRIMPNGTQRLTVATPNRPYALAVDDAHVYYTSNSNFFQRAPLGGGASEEVGSLPSTGNVGYVAVDAERVYWAAADDTGKGFVTAASKAAPAGPKIIYQPIGKGAVGIAVDATNVYWSNEGVPSGNVFTNDGSIEACPKTGCVGPATVVAKQLVAPGSMLVDGDAIYFVSFGTQIGASDGDLRRVAKP